MQTLVEGEWVLRRTQEVHGRKDVGKYESHSPPLPSRRAGTLFHWTGRADKHPLPPLIPAFRGALDGRSGFFPSLPGPSRLTTGTLGSVSRRSGLHPSHVLALPPLPLSSPLPLCHSLLDDIVSFFVATHSAAPPPSTKRRPASPVLQSLPAPGGCSFATCASTLFLLPPFLPLLHTHTPLSGSAPPGRTGGEAVILSYE